MRRIPAVLIAGALACGAGGASAQTPNPLPIIAGNGLVNVLVEVDGSVKTWGSPGSMDPSPSLGDGQKPQNTKAVKAPQTLTGVNGIASASAAVSHVLLLKRDGTVLAWGENDSCELGTGTGKAAYAPVAVPGLSGVTQVVTNAFMSGAVLADGTVRLWGTWQRECIKTPTLVEGLDSVTHLSIDGSTAVALRSDGSVWGWGKNAGGGLCDGTTQPRVRPAPIDGIGRAVAAEIDGNSVFVLADGTVRMCGNAGQDGAFGDPKAPTRPHLTPFQVPGISGVRSIRTTGDTTIVRLNDGTLRAWGNGYYGALGDGHGDSYSAQPHAPIGLGPVLAHYLSQSASYAIRADGTVMVWAVPAPPGGKTEFHLTPVPAFTVKLN